MQTALAVDASLAIARPLSWLVVLAFLGAAVLESRDRERARAVATAAWVLFGAFWLVLVPHFVFEQKSIVEGIGSVAAVPLSLYAGYLLWGGRDSLFVLSRAVGLMGLLYLPVSYVPFLESNPLRQWLVETVAGQTAALLSLIGVEPTLVSGLEYRGIEIPNKVYPYENTFVFPGNTQPITYTIIVACTGIGSIAMLAGAILAVKAPARRKLQALAVSVPVIYVLNLGRNVFIATMFGEQRMQWFVPTLMDLFGTDDPQLVSYYIADRILAQFGSVVALVAITWLIVKILPEILTPVEDLLFLITREDYDLQSALGDSPETPEPGAD